MDADRREKLAPVLAALAVIVLPGLASFALDEAGYQTVGSAVWAIGYGTGILMLWYVWIRPLDITGPESVDRSDPDDE